MSWAGPAGCHHGTMSRVDRAVFRMPAASAAIPLVAVLCVTPLATVGGGWWALYAIPVISAVYIMVTRTTADGAQVSAHSLLGAKRMTWSDMDGLELRDARWTVAVGKDGRRLPLPMVRPRDLPRLAAASGGSLNLDPQASGDLDASAADSAAEGAVADPGAVPGVGAGAVAGAAGDADSSTGDGSRPGDVTDHDVIGDDLTDDTGADDTGADDTGADDTGADRDGAAPAADTPADVRHRALIAEIDDDTAADEDRRSVTADAQGTRQASPAD